MPATLLPAGKYQVTADYGGDRDFAASASAAAALTVTREQTSASLKLSALTVRAGHESSERQTVRIRPQYAGTITGKVTITAKAAGRLAVLVCTITLKSGAGTCTLSASALRPGVYSLTAVYGGSRNFLPSHSPKEALTVKK